ncbi:CPCC family cysteine-rich protein [Streptococcus equinus]|uniref:CPCC family cysteine-rich protein n=1 Tax=Streptococcus equinus TaxID=1335 RepID=UPI000F82C05A|nr:CPCC family cysteine-rich protein [Streptococcus equinus]
MAMKENIIMIDGEEHIHCPVCGRLVQLFDVCECNWENTGETNIDGGPNKMTLAEAREAYTKGLKIY